MLPPKATRASNVTSWPYFRISALPPARPSVHAFSVSSYNLWNWYKMLKTKTNIHNLDLGNDLLAVLKLCYFFVWKLHFFLFPHSNLSFFIQTLGNDKKTSASIQSLHFGSESLNVVELCFFINLKTANIFVSHSYWSLSHLHFMKLIHNAKNHNI